MNFKFIEEKWQKKWYEEKVFEAEPSDKKKFYMLFAYPTVSGTLHVGHARSYTIPDIIARFKRMQGFNVFFPLGFHATGIDCEKILNEVKKNVENAKKYGINPEDAKKFETVLDVEKYLEKKMIKCFKKLGISLDFRPAISTIDLPYNKFIEWQFKKLKDSGYLIKRDYRLAWCPKCNHPVSLDPAEADIKEWKGSQIKDYIVIKFKTNDIIIPASTLRPETIFGVTNIWLNPKAKYVIAKVDGEKWLVSKKAIQKLKNLEKEVEIIEEVKPEEFLNFNAFNPVTKKEVPILAGSFVDPDEATGIVMSVPAHDPFDFIYLKKVAPEIKPIQVVETEGFGKIPAEEILKKYGIKYVGDPRIEDATKELYKIEYKGRMLPSIPKFGGLPVQRAKREVAEWLRKEGNSDMIYELSVKPIHCRCGAEIIIKAVKGQWFIDYGNQKLKDMAKKCVEKMNIYPPEYKNELPSIIDWLEPRACVRKRGIGTKFPFEEGWIIEAISDSTIYMAFFIVSKYINMGKIKVEELTEEFFDYIFLEKGEPKNGVWKEIRKEFDYWYPLDLNAIGKEHKSVHLPFFIMNHVAIFPEKYWPRGIFVNWHLITYGKKMSKHLGNVIFWDDAIENYGSDTVRFYLAHGSNQWEDFDWRNENCEIYKRHLEKFYNIVNTILKEGVEDEGEFIDKWLNSRVNRIIKNVTIAMKNNEIKKALDLAFFTFLNDLNWYKKRKGKYNKKILPIWLKLLAPFIPHTCEELWSKISKTLISKEEWPQFYEENISLKAEACEELIKEVLSDIEEIKKLSKITKPKKITIFVAPPWKYHVYESVLEKKELKEILKEVKKPTEEVIKYYKKLKKKKKLKDLFLSSGTEYKVLNEAKKFFEKEYKCNVFIFKAEEFKHAKALAAEPQKPGILIE